MSILLILVQIILLVFLTLFNKKRAQLISLGMLLFTFIAINLSTHFMLNYLQTYPRYEGVIKHGKVAIVTLGSGSVKTNNNKFMPGIFAIPRIYETIRLYQSCKNQASICKIILSGGDPHHNGVSQANIMATELKAFNINKNDIILETKSNNTYENAKFTSEILTKEKFQQVFLVTSGFHIKRGLKFFKKFNQDLIPSPSDYIKSSIYSFPSAFQFAYFDRAFHEIISLIRY